jgi:hypothetical protein
MQPKDAEWWKSDDARDFRVAQYVAYILFSLPHRRQHFGVKTPPPEWPAVVYYDGESDMPFWVECKSRTHARDFLKGCQDQHVNAALRELAA